MKIKSIEMDAAAGSNFYFRNNEPKNGHLFVKFKSVANVLTREGYKITKPGDFIFYNGEEVVEYGSADCEFRHDYFRFELEAGEDALFDIPTSTLFSESLDGKNEEILRMMAIEFYSVSKNRERLLSLWGKLFMISVSEYVEKLNSGNEMCVRYYELVKLRTEILNSPQHNYTIREIADKICMSPSYFQNVYKKTFGVSCINDIICARIKKAEYFLKKTNKKESEIAELCGYNSVEHFVRQFKKNTGKTPTQFKKESDYRI